MGTNDITGIILAGGASRRMDGKDKAWLSYKGKPLIKHVIERIEPQVDELILSYSQYPEKYQSLPYACYRDYKLGFQGPLTGILSCCRYISTPLVFVVPCDVPFIPINIIQRLSPHIKEHEVVTPHDGIREQYLVFLSKATTLNSIHSYLSSGTKSVRGWLSQQSKCSVDCSEEMGSFENINTPPQLS